MFSMDQIQPRKNDSPSHRFIARAVQARSKLDVLTGGVLRSRYEHSVLFLGKGIAAGSDVERLSCYVRAMESLFVTPHALEKLPIRIAERFALFTGDNERGRFQAFEIVRDAYIAHISFVLGEPLNASFDLKFTRVLCDHCLIVLEQAHQKILASHEIRAMFTDSENDTVIDKYFDAVVLNN
jgi:hypothetical protein